TPDEELVRRAGVSMEAVQLLRSSEVVDLHLESYIPPRIWGFDLAVRHDPPPLRGYFFGHLDFPRALDGGLTGAMWSIATNILRTKRGRLATLKKNVAGLAAAFDRTGGAIRPVRTHAEYVAARREGAHAALIAVQGGNALEAAGDAVADAVPDRLLTRVTLVHLSNSCYGGTSSPANVLTGERGLTNAGRELVRQLDAARIYVDLAHVSKRGFWDAVEVHDKGLPLLVTHTGVDGVKPMWRNVDDAQIRAVADTGGVIGIIVAENFLRPRGGPRDGRLLVDHMAHAIDAGGEDCVAIGTDYDGFIHPPKDLRDGALGYVRLVQHMLDRGFTDTRIRKILGDNFLRTFRRMRP
ncbi:MAG TPA: membrane dipeptidase, partial [Acidimicrobiia bacterium]|nr:membrane dipeptidase [Acidimicrobiia bacterium]